jgi:hypothetical protein
MPKKSRKLKKKHNKKKVAKEEKEEKKKKRPMEEMAELLKSLLTKGMANTNATPIKPTKDDREKFRLQEKSIKSEELQKKLDAQ